MNKILLFLCVLMFGTSQVGGQARPSATPTDALLVWARPTSDARASEVRAIGEAVEAAAELSGYSGWRLAALVKKESGARLDVVGRLGECGPAQVMGWYLKPKMRCAELQTADGGMLGAVRALQQWRRWADAQGLRPGAEYDCYAAGQHCKHYTRPSKATRRIFRGEGMLRGIGAALDTTAGAEAIARATRGQVVRPRGNCDRLEGRRNRRNIDARGRRPTRPNGTHVPSIMAPIERTNRRMRCGSRASTRSQGRALGARPAASRSAVGVGKGGARRAVLACRVLASQEARQAARVLICPNSRSPRARRARRPPTAIVRRRSSPNSPGLILRAPHAFGPPQIDSEAGFVGDPCRATNENPSAAHEATRSEDSV